MDSKRSHKIAQQTRDRLCKFVVGAVGTCLAVGLICAFGIGANAADEDTSPAVTEVVVSDDLIDPSPHTSGSVQAAADESAEADEEAATPQQASDDGLISAGHLYDDLAISDIPVPDEGQEGSAYAAGEAIVLFTAGTSTDAAAAALATYGLSADAQKIEDALATRSFCTASVDDGASVASVLHAIKSQGPAAIQYAQANYRYQLADADATQASTTAQQTLAADATASGATTQTTQINDPDASQQWHLNAINAYDAWDIQKTEDSVSVAVIDTGIMSEHEDLKDRIIDTYNATDDGGTAEDEQGHGTHVAGIVGATTDNDIGVSGVSYNAGLYAIRAAANDDVGSFWTSAILNAFEYILDDEDEDGVSDKYEYNNLRVVNMSFFADDTAEQDACNVAMQEVYDQGILLVAAAGNESLELSGDNKFFPSDYDPCMSVIALDQGMTRSYFSNYGPSTAIAAPGSSILSTVPYDEGDTGDAYEAEDGTSMASPVVAGSAAVVFAHGLATGEDYSPDEVRELLEMSARDVGEPGYDEETAWGCVDLEAALKADLGAHTVTIDAGEHATLLCDGTEVAGGSCTETVAFGETLEHTYTVQPESGYTFAAFEGDDTRAYLDLSDLRISYDVSYTALCLPDSTDETSLILSLTDEEELEPTLHFGEEDEVTVDWGDDSGAATSSAGAATHTYAETGTYTVTLSSEDSYTLGDGAQPFIGSPYASTVLALRTSSAAIPLCFSFSNCSRMVTADLGVCGDTSQVTNMAAMFGACSNLEELTLDGLDTSAATSMQAMFYGCYNLTELDLSGFDTSQVTDMAAMFEYCSSLIDLNVSGLDTSQVTTMSLLFDSCSSLTELDVSGFDTSQVTQLVGTFRNCAHLTAVDLSAFDTSQVEYLTDMFTGCLALTELDLSAFDTSQVTDASEMFRACTSLIELDLSGFDTSQITGIGFMFYSCYSLRSIDLSGWEIPDLNSMARTFTDCWSLESLDLSSFDTSQVTDMGSCFDGCRALRQVTLSDAFTFNGAGDERLCDLPGAESRNLPYEVTGSWVDIATGTAYACDAVPNNVAATYYAESVEPQVLSKDDFEVSPLTFAYTGKALMPDVVSDLFEGTEYTLSATNNVNPGTATLTINGAGNYAGSKLTYEYKITGTSGGGSKASKKKQTIKCKTKVKLKKGGKKLKIKVKGVKTTLCWKANKKAQKALKIKTGTKTLTLKALKKAKKGKTYKIKLWAGVGNNFKKSNVKTIKVKVK